MIINQRTQKEIYKCNDPWFSEKKQSYKVIDHKPCPKGCKFKDGQLLDMKMNGDLKIDNPPIKTSHQFSIKGEYKFAKIDGEYTRKHTYDKNQSLSLSGNGKRTQTWHYIDQNCPQYNQKELLKDTTNLLLNATKTSAVVGSFIHESIVAYDEMKNQQFTTKAIGKGVGNIVVGTAGSIGGSIGGAQVGVMIGAVGGPVGILIGGVFGGLVGSQMGRWFVKKLMPWNWEN